MYLGASPFSALYTSSRTLNWMRNLIGRGFGILFEAEMLTRTICLKTLFQIFCKIILNSEIIFKGIRSRWQFLELRSINIQSPYRSTIQKILRGNVGSHQVSNITTPNIL